MRHLTNKEINRLIRDERHDEKMYERLGLPGIAEQERRHMEFFRMLKAARR
jgi:hypothetical protein